MYQSVKINDAVNRGDLWFTHEVQIVLRDAASRLTHLFLGVSFLSIAMLLSIYRSNWNYHEPWIDWAVFVSYCIGSVWIAIFAFRSSNFDAKWRELLELSMMATHGPNEFGKYGALEQISHLRLLLVSKASCLLICERDHGRYSSGATMYRKQFYFVFRASKNFGYIPKETRPGIFFLEPRR